MHLTSIERNSKLKQIIQTELEQSFQIFDSPLVHYCLIRYAADRTIILLKVHHLITDGFSFEILHRHFAEFYNQYHKGGTLISSDESTYSDYVCWENELTDTKYYQESKSFWEKQLNQSAILLNWHPIFHAHILVSIPDQYLSNSWIRQVKNN